MKDSLFRSSSEAQSDATTPSADASSSRSRVLVCLMPLSFHALQLAAVAFWLLLRRMIGKHLYDLASGSVITRPSWLPSSWLLRLVTYKCPVFVALPVALSLAAVAPSVLLARIAAALVVSAYHLLETAYTSRHGEYPVLYASWAAVLPAPYDRAAIFGVAIHFVLSCGIAKCTCPCTHLNINVLSFLLG